MKSEIFVAEAVPRGVICGQRTERWTGELVEEYLPVVMQRFVSTGSEIRTEGKLASESWTMTRTITCRLFPEKAEFQSLEGGKLVREREYRLEIPDRDFKRLERDASEGQVAPRELVERRVFSVADLPESWKAEPTESR